MINYMSNVHISLDCGEEHACPGDFCMDVQHPNCVRTLETTQNVKKPNFVLAEDTAF